MSRYSDLIGRGSKLDIRIFKCVAVCGRDRVWGGGAGNSGDLIGGSDNDMASGEPEVPGQEAQGLWHLGKVSWRSVRGKSRREGMEEKRSKNPGRAVSLSPLSVTNSV